jgi:predicted enzyme related to lactoylglutathione lyase
MNRPIFAHALRILTLIFSLSSFSTVAHAKSPIAWFDITTTDLRKSRDFYHDLFGWSFVKVQGTDLALNIKADGEEIGTLRVVAGPISHHNGMVYIEVQDINASYRLARRLGATVEAEGIWPVTLPDHKGAIAVVFDPENHPVGMYSRSSGCSR